MTNVEELEVLLLLNAFSKISTQHCKGTFYSLK